MERWIAIPEIAKFHPRRSQLTLRCTELRPTKLGLQAGVRIERCETPVDMAIEVARLHNAAFASDFAFRHYTGAEMAEILAEEIQELWIIRDGDAVVGYCRIEREPKFNWLEQIAIHPNQQKRGFGLALASVALQSIRIDGRSAAGLNVSSVNFAARAMYEKLGFILQRETRRYSASRTSLIPAVPR